ncbi:hypothetical protein AFLA_012806 [Aspergillus flavus NRRL3357]|nr:hypothetical protein AFLA_012806 [Aspergillus flavus NRRL3357]
MSFTEERGSKMKRTTRLRFELRPPKGVHDYLWVGVGSLATLYFTRLFPFSFLAFAAPALHNSENPTSL